MIPYLDMDVHTHTPATDAVFNLNLRQLSALTYDNPKQLLSVGIHPWWITEQWQEHFKDVQRWSTSEQVQWIGETGLDKLKGPSLSLQIEVFKAHIQLSEQVKKPLLIHCVKAVDELLAIKRKMNPNQTWIFHGFRGKPQQLQQLLKAGFLISFGAQFNPASLQACPLSKRLIETDDSGLTLQEVIQKQSIQP